MDRREFVRALAAAAAAGLPLMGRAADDDAAFYEVAPFGNVSLLHLTDCHAQLKPVHFREPQVNVGVAEARGRPPHPAGDALLKSFDIPRQTRAAHAYTS